MELISLKCPNCNSNIFIDDNKERCFCSHCGAQILLNNSNNKSITYTKVDAARIKEAETYESIRKRELDLEKERLDREERELELQRQRLNREMNRERNLSIASVIIKIVAILAVVGVVVYVIDLFFVKNILNVDLRYVLGGLGIAAFYLLALWITRDG